MEKEKVFQMSFRKIYDCLVAKAERKNRTQSEVNQILQWVTGYDERTLQEHLSSQTTYRQFLEQAPHMNPNRNKVKGVICKVRIEEIYDPMMKDIRIIDKMVDELAKGKSLEVILRK